MTKEKSSNVYLLCPKHQEKRRTAVIFEQKFRYHSDDTEGEAMRRTGHNFVVLTNSNCSNCKCIGVCSGESLTGHRVPATSPHIPH